MTLSGEEQLIKDRFYKDSLTLKKASTDYATLYDKFVIEYEKLRDVTLKKTLEKDIETLKKRITNLTEKINSVNVELEQNLRLKKEFDVALDVKSKYSNFFISVAGSVIEKIELENKTVGNDALSLSIINHEGNSTSCDTDAFGSPRLGAISRDAIGGTLSDSKTDTSCRKQFSMDFELDFRPLFNAAKVSKFKGRTFNTSTLLKSGIEMKAMDRHNQNISIDEDCDIKRLKLESCDKLFSLRLPSNKFINGRKNFTLQEVQSETNNAIRPKPFWPEEKSVSMQENSDLLDEKREFKVALDVVPPFGKVNDVRRNAGSKMKIHQSIPTSKIFLSGKMSFDGASNANTKNNENQEKIENQLFNLSCFGDSDGLLDWKRVETITGGNTFKIF